MLRGRAVAFALAVELLLLFAAFLLPGIGHAAVGAAGGAAAGTLAGGGWRPGAEHGAAAGLAGSGVAGVIAVGLALTGGLGVGPIPIGDPLSLHLLGVPALFGWATLAGALGGHLRGRRRFPGRKRP